MTSDTVEVVDAGFPYLAGSRATQTQSLDPVVDMDVERAEESEEKGKPEAAGCPIELLV